MPYIIGVDGGGTKTRAIAADLEGNVCATVESGPSNFQRVGPEGVQKVCRDLLLQLQSRAEIFPDEIETIALGLAGAGRLKDQETVREAVEQLGFQNKVLAQSDAFIALYGAFTGEPGVIIIAGTGSICFGLDRSGMLHRAGGWGYLLGDEGSGYFVGHQAILAVLRAYDGRGPKTALTAAIETALGLDSIPEIVGKLYIQQKIGKEEIASLAPLVFEFAQKGDAVARQIVQQTGRELAQLITAVAGKLTPPEDELKIAYIGSLFKQLDILLPEIEAALNETVPNYHFQPPFYGPAQGAILWAVKEKFPERWARFLQNFSKSHHSEHEPKAP